MNKNIIDFFENTIKKKKNDIAVSSYGENYTFSYIEKKAKLLAREILTCKNINNMPIGVLLKKSHNTVISDIGIAYSGNAFMNMDIKTPKDRLVSIIENIKPLIIITDENSYLLTEAVSKICKNKFYIINIDNILVDNYDGDEKEINLAIRSVYNKVIDTDMSCIINTSGSTGTPKGVALNSKSFFDFVDWSLETFEFNENTVIGSLSPSVFDIYVFELWLMAKVGAKIVILDESMSMFPIKLLEQIKKEKVSFIFWVPSIMVNIANMDLLSRLSLDSLSLIWFAGEVFPTKQFNYWKRFLPDAKFVNLYGPIEITLDCTYYIIEREFNDDEPLPIGYPCNNTDVLILNNENNLCKPNEEGELCVRGTSLALGYYNDFEKTTKVFTQNPLNKVYPEIIYRTGDLVYINDLGEIIFKGRKDSLIKRMGYRIELGEIEHIITNQLGIVKYCCAVYKVETKEIILFYENNNEISIENFRKKLSNVFPKYMLPDRFVRTDKLPQNTNGKIDRQKLKEMVNDDEL